MPLLTTHRARIRPSHALLMLLLVSGCARKGENDQNSKDPESAPEQEASSNLDTPGGNSGPELTGDIPRDAHGIPIDAPVSEESRALVGELMDIFARSPSI